MAREAVAVLVAVTRHDICAILESTMNCEALQRIDMDLVRRRIRHKSLRMLQPDGTLSFDIISTSIELTGLRGGSREARRNVPTTPAEHPVHQNGEAVVKSITITFTDRKRMESDNHEIEASYEPDHFQFRRSFQSINRSSKNQRML